MWRPITARGCELAWFPVRSTGSVADGGVRVPGGLRRLQSGWQGRSPCGGFDSRPPPPNSFPAFADVRRKASELGLCPITFAGVRSCSWSVTPTVTLEAGSRVTVMGDPDAEDSTGKAGHRPDHGHVPSRRQGAQRRSAALLRQVPHAVIGCWRRADSRSRWPAYWSPLSEGRIRVIPDAPETTRSVP